MSEHGTRQWIADGDPKPSSRMPKGSCPQHPFAEWCEHGGVLTGTRPVAVCSVCRQPDPEGAHRHACE